MLTNSAPMRCLLAVFAMFVLNIAWSLNSNVLASVVQDTTTPKPICKNMFQCSNGRCIPLVWQCDKDYDCETGDDEDPLLCSNKNKITRCNEQTDFQCSSSSSDLIGSHTSIGGQSHVASLFSNLCIPITWKCDGEFDCPNRDDERSCKQVTCKENQFQCTGFMNQALSCIPKNWKCDGQNDCAKGEDENPEMCKPNEHLKCDNDEFKCDDGTRCIYKDWKCDGDIDCEDSSDEKNCNGTNVCDTNLNFQCKDVSFCIPKSWRCDGHADCIDQSDEADCKAYNPTHNVTCKPNESRCISGSHCVHNDWICDGDYDCPDRSDEADCDRKVRECRPGTKRCGNTGICRPETDFCNGFKECPNGEDEGELGGCKKSNPGSFLGGCDHNTHYVCPHQSAECIPYDQLCAKNISSNDCSISACNNNTYLGTCKPEEDNNIYCKCNQMYNRRGRVCYCPEGFETVSKRCVDIDECKTPGVCDQICTNLVGSYKCECHPHYKLVRDSSNPIATHCRASGADPLLLLSNRAAIRQYDMITNKYHPLVNSLESAVAMDYWHQNRSLIWSDVSKEQIMMCQMDEIQYTLNSSNCVGNTTNITLVGDQVSTPDGLAVDWVHGLLFWTDTGLDKIFVLNLQTRQRRVLIEDGLDEPRAIAVDPSAGLIFWTDWGANARIERAGMDGKNRMEIVSGKTIRWPNGLAVDILDKRIYWADAKMKMISSCNYYGKDVRTVLHSNDSLRHPFSLTVFEERLYWTDWDKEGVLTVNKFRGDDAQVLVSGINGPMTVRVYHRLAQPEHPNKCENHQCSHMCLPRDQYQEHEFEFKQSVHKLPYTCACPMGMKMSPEDMATCIGDSVLMELAGTNMTGSHFSFAFFVLFAIASALALAAYVWRGNRHRSFASFQFDNPIYRRTTEDPDSLEFGAPPMDNFIGAIPSETINPPLVPSRLVLNQPITTSGMGESASRLTSNDFYHPDNYSYDQLINHEDQSTGRN